MPDMNENAETQQEYFGIMTDEEIEVIIKPIFTKMFKANFSACEYGIECYKKGMEYQGIKELAKENDNLIKGNAYLKKQIEKMKCCYNCSKWNDGQCADVQNDNSYYSADFVCEDWEIKEK